MRRALPAVLLAVAAATAGLAAPASAGCVDAVSVASVEVADGDVFVTGPLGVTKCDDPTPAPCPHVLTVPAAGVPGAVEVGEVVVNDCLT